MPNAQRRRHPRSDFVQDGLSPSVAQQIGRWESAFDFEAASFATRKRNQQHNGYTSPAQDGPIAYLRANADMVARTGALYTWAPRTPKRPVLYPHTEPQQGWIFTALFPGRLYDATDLFAARPPKRSTQQYKQLEDWTRFTGLAPPLGPDTNQIPRDPFWSRPAPRKRAASTPADDGWLNFASTPVSPFDPTTMFAALDQFAQRVTYRTGRKPSKLGGGATPPAPPFDTSVVPLDTFTPVRPPARKGFPPGENWDFQQFGTPLDESVVWPANEDFWTRPPTRQRLYPSTTQQDGWLFTNLPVGFDAQYWPPNEPFSTRPPQRKRLYPSTEPQPGSVANLTTNVAATYPFAERTAKRKGLYPHTEQQDGWIYTAVQLALFNPNIWPPEERFFALPPRRARLYPHTEPQDGWITANQFPAATEVAWGFADRTPKRKGLYPSTEQQDGWIFKAIPPFDATRWPPEEAFWPRPPRRARLYPSTDQQQGWAFTALFPANRMVGGWGFADRPPRRARLYPHTEQQDGWITTSIPERPHDGGGGTTYVPRWQIQYQDIAEPFAIPLPSSTVDAEPSTQLMPGAQVQYDAHVEPLFAPADVPVVVPDGVAAYTASYPNPTRLRTLPEWGTAFVLVIPLEVSGSALSWVPVYHGKPGLPAYEQQAVPSFFFLGPGAGAPPGTAAYAAVYPDRAGRSRTGPNGNPNVGESITEPLVPIVPPAPPTQHHPIDLRRRQMLLIRRLIS